MLALAFIKVRKIHNASLLTIAKRSGLSIRHSSDLMKESGKPSVCEVALLCESIGCTVNELMAVKRDLEQSA